MNDPGTITRALRDWNRGRPTADNELLRLVYDEMQRMASRRMRGERSGHTLEPAALVHETYLRMVQQKRVDWLSRGQFFAVASRVMGRILIDHARRRGSLKRGADPVRVRLHNPADPTSGFEVEALAVNTAINKLETIDPRKARMIEMRFFGGMTIQETAAALGCSPGTVSREWRLAKAWLAAELDARSAASESP